MNALINQCTDRKLFLSYILHEIISLKALQEKKNSFTPTKLEEYKNKVSQLFIDLKLLLDTPKHKTYRVTCSNFDESAETSIALSGLKNDEYLGGDLCNSGLILNESVLKQFHLSLLSSEDKIRDIAKQICIEHQNALLVPELLTQNASQEKLILEQEKKLDLLSTPGTEKSEKSISLSTKQLIILYFWTLDCNDQIKNKDVILC